MLFRSTSVGTNADSSTFTTGASTLFIGSANTSGNSYFYGNLSNIRINTTAVYTGSFTPSTTPLTAISGTQFLSCQSNRFIDNSSNAFALTATGTPSVQRFSPFNPTLPYSTTTIGGSGYFDGSGDYLSLASNSNLAMGSGNFTVEYWLYPKSVSGASYVIDQQTSGSLIYYYDSKNSFY